MMAASREKRVTALILAEAPGVSGADLTLYQASHSMERSTAPDDKKQATLALQKQIQVAVLTGKGWEGVPNDLRRQADVPWFQSFLAYDPAKVMPRVRQPLLIVQGLLDTQVPPSNGDQLEKLARARKKTAPVEVSRLAGVNHLLAAATTGEADEYNALPDKHVSSQVTSAISGWLKNIGF